MPLPLPRRSPRVSTKAGYSYNRQLDIIRSLSPSGGPGTLASVTTRGTFYRTRRLRRLASGGANIALFRIAGIGVGSLSCNEVSIVNGVQSWDPNAIITVNMPYGITGNSVTITEGSGASSTTIAMGLEPVYAVDNFIFAVEADDGGWWDLNIAARHYEPPWQQVVVCLRENSQDVKRYMWIRGSAPFGTVP